MHEGTLLTDIAWIMVGAMVAALICQKVKLPPLLGYLIAGFFLGPHLGLWPPLVHQENVTGLSELGVIFLMFYIGLEFDLKRLRQIVAPASIALILQTLLMLYVGIEAGGLLGLSPINGIFLGGVLSISSSMVSLKLIRDIGVFQQPHAQLTVGILILEDILAILLLVLLGGVAQEGQLDWTAIGQSALLIVVFVVAVFFIGKLSAPRVIRALEMRGTTESITLVTLGLIFGVSLIADTFHFSWALGGFLAGAILSRSRLAQRIEHLTEPLRDFFCAMFFVSVGMLIDPKGLWHNWLPIAILSVVVITGKFLSCWIGLFLSGQSPREAGRASIIKSQIGEFGFVIVAIAIHHDVASSDLQAIVSGVAFITIFATPFLIRDERVILDFLARRVPRAARNFSFLYSKWLLAIRIVIRETGWLTLAGKPIARIAIDFIIFIGFILAAVVISETILPPQRLEISQVVFQRFLFVTSLLLSLPFLVDTVRNLNVLMLLLSDAALSQRVFQQFSKRTYRSVFNALILIVLFFIYGGLFFTVAGPYFPTLTSIGAFLGLAFFLGWVFWQRLVRMHNSWELAFMNSMQQEAQRRISQHIATGLKNMRTQQVWQVKVEPFVISPESRWIGKRIQDIDLRKTTGAMIAGIERGGFDLTNIGPLEILYPNDHVFLLGEPEQIEKAKAILDAPSQDGSTRHPFLFAFDRVVIPPFSQLIGVPIQDSDLRKNHHVTIVAIQRKDKRIVGPHPSEVLEEDDLLLLMGSEEDLAAFKKALLELAIEVSG